MRWSFIKKVLLLLFCLNGVLSAGEWSEELRRMGMENIREADREEGCYLSWEDPVYRGSCRGLAEVIRRIAQKSWRCIWSRVRQAGGTTTTAPRW